MDKGPSHHHRFPVVAGYELLDELGRGTTGVVYKARQKALNRPVALKMILAGGHASAEQLTRFETEARAVAAIKHPNIVQIYDLGESAGLPFLSLEFVEGSTLDVEIDGIPQSPEHAVGVIERLATGVEAAHSKGIIHRDLKPANVLIAGDGTPKITDFGLAKELESKSSQTRSGSQIGTPSYMAPEQALCESYGPAVDIYALGAILYEMLVGRPPFLGASPYETTLLVVNEEPVRPSLLVAKVPADVETICLKCLQKDPARRYANAADLVEDCRRFLHGEPILARPISPVERMWRWCRRNPRTAGLAAAVIGLLAVVAVGSTAAAVLIDKSRQESVKAEKIADAAKADALRSAAVADKRTGFALGSIKTLIDGVQRLKDVPGTANLREELLEISFEDVNALANELKDERTAETTTLAIHMLLADIYRSLGKTSKALDQFVMAHTIAWNRARDMPDNKNSQGNLAVVLSRLAALRHEFEHDAASSLDCHQQALAIWRKLHAGSKDEPEREEAVTNAGNLAEAATNLGVFHLHMGHPEDATPLIQEAIDLRLELVAAYPDTVEFRDGLAVSYQAMGEACNESGAFDEAIRYYRLSLETNEATLAAAPRSDAARLAVAETLGNYADLLARTGKIDEARRDVERSLAIHREILEANQTVVDQARNVAYDLHRLGTIEAIAGNSAESSRYFDEARQMRERIAAFDPNNSERQIELMQTLARCGEVTRATAIAESVLAHTRASNSDIQIALGRCYAQCSAFLRSADPKAADALADDAVEAIRYAVAAGYRDRFTLMLDPDLLPLQPLPAFQQIISELTSVAASRPPSGD